MSDTRFGRRERSLLLSFSRAVSSSSPIVDSALRAIGGIDDAVRLPVRRHRSVRASMTKTPTGVVSMSASRSARAR